MGIFSDLLGDEETRQVKEWFKDNYSSFPTGIQGYGSRDYEDVVTVELAEPLDTDVFADIIEDHGYESIIDEEANGLWVGIYDVESNPGGGQGKRLVSALSFKRGREVAIGSDPINPNGTSDSFQLDYLKEYLETKHV